MNARDAWSTLGRDIDEVLAAIRASPVHERGAAADRELETARSVARKLMGAHHPDRNPGDPGAPARFGRVQEALRILEGETADLKQRLSEGAARNGRDVFIEVRKPR